MELILAQLTEEEKQFSFVLEPTWIRDALPVAEETLAGGALLGVAAAALAFVVVRRALAGRGGTVPGGASED